MAATAPVCDFGRKAPAFALPGTDGRIWSFAGIAGPKIEGPVTAGPAIAGPRATLIMFICNHCPYVQAVLDRILRDARDLRTLGVGVAAISSNDAAAYPEDGFAAMQALAAQKAFPFPYLHDETQSVARAYDAACTPDFFGFDAGGGLQYRGRLDASGRATGPADLRRDLYEAMKMIAETGHGPRDQIASIGCSIKWKT